MVKIIKKFSHQYMMVMTCVVIEGSRRRDCRVLIIKRSKKESEGSGLWTIPGGRIEPTDWKKLKIPGLKRNYFTGAFEKACCRELREETGLVANKFHTLVGHEIMFIRSSGQPTIVLAFWTKKSKWQKIRLNPDSHKWIKPDELDNYQFIGDVKNCIRTALNVASS